MKKRLIKRLLGAALAGTMAIGLAACGSETTAAETNAAVEKTEASSGTADTEKTEELKALRIGIGGSADGCVLEGAALAVKDGYFEEELAKVGYYPEYIYFSGAGPEINEAFAGGNIDAAIVGDFPTFTAKSNGIDNTIIAATNQKVNYAILTTVEDAESIHDLKDYTAVVFGGSVSDYFWQSYLEAEGIGANEIAHVNSTDATTLLTSGDAQIYPVTAYCAYFFESIGLGHVIDTKDVNIFTTFVFEINTNLIKTDPDIGVAVNKALIRASNAAQTDPQKQFDASAGANFDAAAWEKYYSADPTLSNLSPEITDELIEFYKKESQWMLDNGIIITPVDVDTFVDTSFYEKALSSVE
ncbi:MAG: ABC transporter substrate-binding protein [Oscillospiraceae bacterium]